MDVQQLRKRLKKRAERARVAQEEQECLYCCKKNRAPFLSGAARVFDVGATFDARSFEADPHLLFLSAKFLDAEALSSDWKRVGGFWWGALDKVTEDLDDEAMVRIINAWRAAANQQRGLSSDEHDAPRS